MVVTSNGEHARAIRMLRDWGAERKYEHVLQGYNYRLESIQGAILRVKLRYLEKWTEARRVHAARYDALLEASGVQTPRAQPHNRHVYHVYAVRSPRRHDLQQQLNGRGVQTGIHYPIPVHLLKAHADLGRCPGDFPCSEHAASEVLSLPMFPEMTDTQQDVVVNAIRQAGQPPA
jgi:dTDP-4-amino-4,6-dideoxygalactose transaminase